MYPVCTHFARPFKLKDTEVCELVRVALAPGRRYPTSKWSSYPSEAAVSCGVIHCASTRLFRAAETACASRAASARTARLPHPVRR